MVLPTKHLALNRSLLGIGADVLVLLQQPISVSRMWEEFKQTREGSEANRVPFDWFILALDLLYMVGAVEYRRGRLVRGKSS
jgi:hypothetical protein